jgi:hypothetical protein
MLKNILALIVTFCLTAIAPAQVAVAVGGGWGGVAVSTGGYYGGGYAYAGTGYYGGYYGGVVAPVGGWYPFYYTSSMYAAPVPQVLPIAQPCTPYTVAPCYVQPVVVQQPCNKPCPPKPCN